MSQSNQASENEKRAAATPPTRKKPYQKPEFRYERVFETMALACGKVITQGTCQHVKKRS